MESRKPLPVSFEIRTRLEPMMRNTQFAVVADNMNPGRVRQSKRRGVGLFDLLYLCFVFGVTCITCLLAAELFEVVAGIAAGILGFVASVSVVMAFDCAMRRIA